MTALADVFARAPFDPLVRYALLAAGLLAVASLLGGAVRRDLAALTRPATGVAIAAALLASIGVDAAQLAMAAADALPIWAQGDWSRLPLWLLAIGYGPSVGVVAGALVIIADLGPGPLSTSSATLLLEIAAIGWLALGPSPRRTRWAAPLAIGLGWALASVTLGLAAWAAEGRTLAPDAFALGRIGAATAVVLAALVATVPSPGWWRRRVPGASDPVQLVHDDDPPRVVLPLRQHAPERTGERRARRHTSAWAPPRPPRPLTRPRGRRRRLSRVPRPTPHARPADAERLGSHRPVKRR